ncbi:Ferredoxin reductase [Thioalkalivibrio nitratireducens DSM 14787]|uniref:Ferredoxin reductase n=1 Tax=Thioalkalivibrio nitratireducens (strain DSM 14787 / UNIQEM 213 / ALEN2) TaxID=1255043 RepID=L0E083_THIND|nr:Ferredoxin reductase [Thioalkalivibrio nitratireducens DSM 14787]
MDQSPGYLFFEHLTRQFSPYELNPLNLNPLRDLVAFQKPESASRVRSRPGRSSPSAITTAFIAPALVPLTLAMRMRASSSSRSSTPEVSAP